MSAGPRPYALLAELTYRCPLHCPYCSNPTQAAGGSELTAEEWAEVFRQAAALGVLHVGLSGGEPLARPDLDSLVAAARSHGLYTNLITSGLGLTETRAARLRDAGLQSVQISLQAHEEKLADTIAGTRAHRHKEAATAAVRQAGLALSMNIVVHRSNIGYLPEMIALAASLGAERLEIANVQYYGWAALNRDRLLPTREQVQKARETALEAIRRYQGQMAVLYVLPDFYESRPKPCMQGWGMRYLTVRPTGEVLPCPTAGSIPDLKPESVRERSLAWIWNESAAFNRFRGTDWMPDPCKSCDLRETDFGGCRCQAALLAGDAAASDPVCTLSPHRAVVDGILARAGWDESPWIRREHPAVAAAGQVW
ncbi:MAG TPA: pyrroloquinoline quinone biosynthesis protein PqqE [Prosthecobacter sp.]